MVLLQKLIAQMGGLLRFMLDEVIIVGKAGKRNLGERYRYLCFNLRHWGKSVISDRNMGKSSHFETWGNHFETWGNDFETGGNHLIPKHGDHKWLSDSEIKIAILEGIQRACEDVI
jgi:hypothetical protein